MTSRAACMRRALVLPLLVSALTAHATRTSLSGQDTDTEPRPLVVDDLFGLRGVGNPTLSPDGSRVAFTVTTTELDEERSWTQVWTASIDGSDARPMTRHGTSAGSPSFSPDGTWLTFTASREGPDGPSRNQVWALDLRGGEARALTSIPQGVSGYRWSPDGTRLALLIRDRDPEDVDSTKTWTSDRPKPWVIDRLQFKRDGAGYLTRLRTHLYVWDLESEALTRLTDGDFDNGQPAWSPDGQQIAFVSNRTDEPDSNANSDIWVVPAGGVRTEMCRNRVASLKTPDPTRAPHGVPMDGGSSIRPSPNPT